MSVDNDMLNASVQSNTGWIDHNAPAEAGKLPYIITQPNTDNNPQVKQITENNVEKSADVEMGTGKIGADLFDAAADYSLEDRLKDAELFAIKVFESAPSDKYKVNLARLLRAGAGITNEEAAGRKRADYVLFDQEKTDQTTGTHLNNSGHNRSIQNFTVGVDNVRENIIAIVESDKVAAPIGCYVRVALLKPTFNGVGRGTEKDTAGTMTLWVDLDTYKTPFSKQEVFDRIVDGFGTIPAPSMIVDSGNGLQVYWFLSLICVDADIIKQVNKSIATAMKHLGGDSTFSTAQLLRIPGTTNRKDPSEPKNVRIVHYNRLATYQLDQFPQIQEHEKKFIAQTELPDGFLAELQKRFPAMYNRIATEESAIIAGAKTKSNGAVDRSSNDAWVAMRLFSLNCIGSFRITSGLLLSLFRRDDLFIGAKTAELGEDYALRTILNAEKYMNKVRNDDPQRFFSGRIFVPALLGEEILLEQHFLSSGSQLWIYRDGVFVMDAEHELRKIIAHKLSVKWQRSHAFSVVDWVRAMSTRNLAEDVAPLANVKNGMLKIDANHVELLDHSPTYCSMAQMDVSYMEPQHLGPELEIVDKFVGEILGSEDSVKAFFQFAGTILLPDYRFKKVLLLIGPGDCGKSTLLSLLLNVIGPSNTAARTFQDLAGGNRFAKASLLGKLANIYADLPALEAKDVGPFKALTGNDIVDAEFKGVDAVIFRNFAKLIFSANVFPQVKMADQAFFNRWLILPCNNKFVQDAKTLARIRKYEPNLRAQIVDRDKITKLRHPKILSAFLWRSIEGLQSLLAHEDFAKSEESHLALGEFMAASDSVSAFMSSCTVADDKHRVLKSDLYDAFQMWCTLLNIEKVSIRIFNRRLAEMRSSLGFFEATNSSITAEDGTTRTGNVITGRRLKKQIVTSSGNTIAFNASFEIQKTWED